MKDLFISRKFWVAAIGLLIIVVGAFLPGYSLDDQALADLVIIVVGFGIGLAVDPGDPLAKWAGLLKSRKFWAAVVGIVVIFLNSFSVALPAALTPDQLTAFVLIVTGYIGAVAFEKKPALL